MFGIFLVALIIYAVVQHRKRNRMRWMKYADWSKYDWSKHDWSQYGRRSRGSRDWSKWAEDAKASTTASAERFASDLHSEDKARFDSKMARKFEAKAERFERKMQRRFDKQTQKYSGVSADPAENMPPPPQFKNDAERQTYERARKRAQAEAGFFVHLMWYGIIIGFLFIINMMTTPFGGYPWFIWPALGWGFGIASHFSAVYGWRWVHRSRFPARGRARSSARSSAGEGAAADREAGVARRVDRDLRARNSQSDRRGEEPGAADGRGSRPRTKTSNTRRSRSTSSHGSSAACRIC